MYNVPARNLSMTTYLISPAIISLVLFFWSAYIQYGLCFSSSRYSNKQNSLETIEASILWYNVSNQTTSIRSILLDYLADKQATKDSKWHISLDFLLCAASFFFWFCVCLRQNEVKSTISYILEMKLAIVNINTTHLE